MKTFGNSVSRFDWSDGICLLNNHSVVACKRDLCPWECVSFTVNTLMVWPGMFTFVNMYFFQSGGFKRNAIGPKNTKPWLIKKDLGYS